MIVAFDTFEIDPEAFELRENGRAITLEPQVFEVLAYLAQHAGRLVLKEELLDEIWGDRFVSESALTSRIKTARKAIGDDGRNQRYIKTVHGKGYRFEGALAPKQPVETRPPLPAERTPLFGRDDDIADVGRALLDDRLVSLLGIGGAGKTRLAIATARSITPRFDGGVFFIDLVPIEHGDELDGALAAALGLSIGPGAARPQIVDLLSDRECLIIFDNVEHLSDDVAELLDLLLESTSAPRFLVTSRVPVDLVDERRIAVEPLPVIGDSSGPAVEMFVRSARRFGVTIADDELKQVADVCRFLDGMPLAIELAAAQLRMLDLRSLAARLDERFELLVGSERDPDRHASLLAVLTDTWNSLTADERAMLVTVAAFPGSFDHEALDGVLLHALGEESSTVTARTLRRLLDHSLIVREHGPQLRFRLLETVKLHVRLQSDPDRMRAALDGHAAWCRAATGGDLSAGLFDFALSDWCASHGYDLRAAERHLSATGRPDEAAELVAATALAMHCDSGPRAAETLHRLDSIIELASDSALVARLRFVGVMCAMATRAPELIDEQGRLGLEAAEASGDRLLMSLARVLRAWSVVFVDPAAALELTEQAVADADAVGDTSARIFAHAYEAFIQALGRQYDEATEIAGRLIEQMTPSDRRTYPYNVALAAFSTLRYLSDPDETVGLADAIMALPSREHPMWANQLIAAALFASAGQVDECRSTCFDLHRRLERSGHTAFPDLLVPIAALAFRRGDRERSRRWVMAVRHSERSTQSFQATVLYRRLREALEAESSPTGDEPAVAESAAADEALDWLHAL